MRKYYFTIALILFLVVGLASCSNEENKTQNNTSSRPTVPILANEVQIGNQIWMTKNLNVSRYRNGDLIPQVTNPTQWANLTTGAWCYYNNDSANGSIYGKLYNWYAINDPRGLAPVGWHLPSDSEWSTLTTFLGGISVAGGKMKSTGTLETTTGLWNSPNLDVNNSSGFTGLPRGYRSYYLGTFANVGKFAIWWSSSGYNDTRAWNLSLQYTLGGIVRNNAEKASGFSVRFLKD